MCVGCALLCAFTTGKLTEMSRLRGESPGAPERVMTVEREVRRFNPSLAEYELNDARHGVWRIQLTQTQIERVRYREPVTVRCLEDERECFVPDSIYVDDGNLGFDRALRMLEVFGLFAAALRIVWRLRAWRRELRAWAQQNPPSRHGPSGALD